jgi:hypothetical protein
MKRFLGRMGGDVSATPTEIKVLIGDDTEGIDAKFLARDTELDLAWIQIKEPGDQKFAYVDLAADAKGKIGDSLLAVRRLGKHFNRVPAIGGGRIGGMTTKPRDLYVPGGDLSGVLGLPVFTPEGKVLGVAITQTPDDEDLSDNPMGAITRLSGLQDMFSGMILPASEARKATERAKANPTPEQPSEDDAEEDKEEIDSEESEEAEADTK